MKKFLTRGIFLFFVALLLFSSCNSVTSETETESAKIEQSEAAESAPEGVQISEEELYDKLLGGWIGQMVGVTWAAPTEFRWCGEIIPEQDFPLWSSSMINDAFGQDDLYVEIPFLDAMMENGALCDGKYLAEKFRDSQFPLWHANVQGRQNLRNGIEYPDSGSYKYNYHCDDIDWQIECDFLGQMYPGLFNDAALRAFDLGHIMNYGDGVYGGVFITSMHAAAYTAESIDEIVEAGISVIPEGTLFRQVMDDVKESYENGDTWEENWQKLEDKWTMTDRCVECSGVINIDAKLNSAYVLIGLLYGQGDFAETIKISGRCGQDSDCNPSSAASILGNFYGASGIDEVYKKNLDYNGRKFSNTNYTLEEVLEINFDLMKQILMEKGFERSEDGIWTIVPDAAYETVPFEQWPDELSAIMQITELGSKSVKVQLTTFGGEVASVRFDMGDGFMSDIQPAVYTYTEPGNYTVCCMVTDTKGNELKLEQKIEVEEFAYVPGKVICTVTAPTGGGNKDLGSVYDGAVAPVGDSTFTSQYDTYDGGKERDSLYIGVEFDCSVKLTGVKFTEGIHFWDGGWFEDEPQVEVLIGGDWSMTSSTVTPDYPDGNTQADHGASFESYTFKISESVVCEGVRIVGVPGGSAYFISASEITPIVEEIYSDTIKEEKESAIIVCSVTSPTGGGASDITVICDGVTPNVSSANDKMQYDTYTGGGSDVPAYIGYLYKTERDVQKIIFTEGNHFNNGGWWKNGEVYAEVLVNGEWIRPACSVSPDYPKADSQGAFGAGYQTYTFTFDEAVRCTGVRLNGIAGGTSGFISTAELTVE